MFVYDEWGDFCSKRIENVPQYYNLGQLSSFLTSPKILYVKKCK